MSSEPETSYATDCLRELDEYLAQHAESRIIRCDTPWHRDVTYEIGTWTGAVDAGWRTDVSGLRRCPECVSKGWPVPSERGIRIPAGLYKAWMAGNPSKLRAWLDKQFGPLAQPERVVPAASADAVTSGTFMLAGHWHQDPDTDTEWRTLVPVDPSAPGQLNGKVEALGEAAEADPPFGPLDENTEGHMIVFQTEHDKHDKEEAARRGKATRRRKAAATTHTEDKEQGEAAPEEPQRHEPRPDGETLPGTQDASPPDGAA